MIQMMISFACKDFNLDVVVKCSLGLTKADFRTLRYLMDHSDQWFSTQELADELGLNVTTVQRAVKSLFESDLLVRHQENLANGGYTYEYQLRPKRVIRDKIMNNIALWTEQVRKSLEKW